MGYWDPSRSLGFQCRVSMDPIHIFYLEALSVLSALVWAISQPFSTSLECIAIFTDNMNTVDMFNSLRAQPKYNPILLTSVDLSIKHNMQFRIFHIPGELNTVADPLSRFRNDIAIKEAAQHTHLPLQISLFQPPHLTEGVAKK
ncbi:hypothetical protein M422DRAFT_176203 [Sphaerobolus stellatus SS14]|uniref:RNase H type-1 domain-containing protein n=1 Tax=Sphaerobolus stellatus (strain SS14) TaxID=990650 RepID=A0A0C9VLY9_SPHS4|nr:hypothetical protein M422DRAFT_176203 [Sphaerobolus stellatus SS14]